MGEIQETQRLEIENCQFVKPTKVQIFKEGIQVVHLFANI